MANGTYDIIKFGIKSDMTVAAIIVKTIKRMKK